MPVQFDHSARELLLLLAGSALFALSGLLLGATPMANSTWRRFQRALAARPSVARVCGLIGLFALPISGWLLAVASPATASSGDPFALFIAGLFALGILGLTIGQAGETPRSRPRAGQTDGTVGPSSATIETFNAKASEPPVRSRAA